MDESMKKKFSDICKIIHDKDRELEVIKSTNKFYENIIKDAEKELATTKKSIDKKKKHLELFLIPNYELLHSTRKGLQEKQRVILDALGNQDHLNFLINKNRERVETENQKLEIKCKIELQERRDKYIADNKPLYERFEEAKNKLKFAKFEEHTAIVELAKRKEKNALKKRIQQQRYYGFFVNLAKHVLMRTKLDELEKLKIQQVELMQKLQERKSKTKEAHLKPYYNNNELREVTSFSFCSPPSTISFNDKENQLMMMVDNDFSRVTSTGINVIENTLLINIPEAPILDPAMDLVSIRKRKLNEFLKLKESYLETASGILKPKSVMEPKKVKLVQFQLTEEQIEKEQEISVMREEILKTPIETEKMPNKLVVEQNEFNLAHTQLEEDNQVEKKDEYLMTNEQFQLDEGQVIKKELQDEFLTECELVNQKKFNLAQFELKEDEQAIIIENTPTPVVERKKFKSAQFQINDDEQIEKPSESLIMDKELFKKPIEIANKTSSVTKNAKTNNADNDVHHTHNNDHTKRFSLLNQNNSFLLLSGNEKENDPYNLQDVTNIEETNILSQLEEADVTMDMSLNALNSSWNNEMYEAEAITDQEEVTDTDEEVRENISNTFSIFNIPSATSFQRGCFSFGSKNINPFAFL